MLNPAIAADIAQTLHVAVTGIATVLLVPLGVGIVYTVVKTIGVVIQNQRDSAHSWPIQRRLLLVVPQWARLREAVQEGWRLEMSLGCCTELTVH